MSNYPHYFINMQELQQRFAVFRKAQNYTNIRLILDIEPTWKSEKAEAKKS